MKRITYSRRLLELFGIVSFIFLIQWAVLNPYKDYEDLLLRSRDPDRIIDTFMIEGR
jgi:hypothetical protein